MKRLILLVICLLFPLNTWAMGNSGYDGGISAGYLGTYKEYYDYKEVVFITGEPIVFEGTLEITRRERDDSEKITYKYDLTHGNGDVLTRLVNIDTQIEKNNGQITKTSVFSKEPTETIRIGDLTYDIDKSSNNNLSMGIIIDDKAFSDYFAGNFNIKKIYELRNGNQRVEVNYTGELFGYDQKWSNTETQEVKVIINSIGTNNEISNNWSGGIDIKTSTSMLQKMIYVNNKPNEISFKGGYLQKQENDGILTYSARLPLFDSEGIATDTIKTYEDDLSVKSFPEQKRLIVPNLSKIRGHWYEKDVKQLYSLNIFDSETDPPESFKPNEYMTRAEFAKALSLLGDLVQNEEQTRVNPRLLKENDLELEFPFEDVPDYHPYYKYIKAVWKNKVMNGPSIGRFEPDSIITRAQALTTFIRALGFEGLAPNPIAVTKYKDNDQIPSWARNSIKVATYIGLVKGDDYGYVNPDKPMTKAEGAAIINRLISYMRYNIINDYKNRIFTY